MEQTVIVERRGIERVKTDLDVMFSFSSVEFGFPVKIESEGKIVDISDRGFGLKTPYPLQNGHFITIKGGGRNGRPVYGLVKWVRKINDMYRAGLGYRFKDY